MLHFFNGKIQRILLLLAVLGGGIVLWQSNYFGDEPENIPTTPVLQKISIGIQTGPGNALVMVAKDQGFFEKHGLDVELKEFTAGKFAMEAFLGGSLDFSISGDVPVMLATLQGNQMLVPAQLVAKTVNEVRVVARKDGDLTNASDYFKAKKRKLATSIGGGPEFFTYEFLNKLGIDQKEEIEIISQKPEDMPAALVSGSVDAIAVFDPPAFFAERRLGEAAITFTDDTIYSELYVLEARPSVRQDYATLEKVLQGLLEAENFTRENPEAAKVIVMQYTKIDRETIDGIWGSFDFRVALTPRLLDFWSREAQWAKDTGKVVAESVTPSFRDIIFDAPLKKLAPTAVEL